MPCISIKLTQNQMSWKDGTSVKGGLHQMRAWARLWSIFSMISVGEPNAWCVVSLLCTWSSVVVKK